MPVCENCRARGPGVKEERSETMAGPVRRVKSCGPLPAFGFYSEKTGVIGGFGARSDVI